ncbi:MAG TPA: glycosyltransferase [Methylovirgula sp.]|nr:glycosyltransferase [Methylovirgula sp.]
MRDGSVNFVGYGSPVPRDRAVETGSAAAPLQGKTVLLIHPAWHSCGSHKVFVAQAQAYRALGARLLELAIADFPGQIEGSAAHAAYLGATQDLQADRRYFTGMPLRAVLAPAFLRSFKDWLHGNYAAVLVETARLASLPAEVMELPEIDLIHCNHFFCMLAAVKVRGDRGCPILLDTHDLQARQFALRQPGSWTLPPAATYDSMLRIELDNMAAAEVLIHLNAEEAATFEQLMPDKRHVLIFPAVEPISTGRGRSDIIIVASANYPNFLGIAWFLSEVMPHIPDAPVKIIGNIDQEFRRRAPALFREHAASFAGYTGDLNKAYAEAAAVLLPVTEGFGISIKTIEALSSGAPLIATERAFRGMGTDPAQLANVTLASDALEFAAAIRQVTQANCLLADDRMKSDTRRLYDRVFSPVAYRQALAALAKPLLHPERKQVGSANR